MVIIIPFIITSTLIIILGVITITIIIIYIGIYKVCDFGLVKVKNNGAGTPAYMPPGEGFEVVYSQMIRILEFFSAK